MDDNSSEDSEPAKDRIKFLKDRLRAQGFDPDAYEVDSLDETHQEEEEEEHEEEEEEHEEQEEHVEEEHSRTPTTGTCCNQNLFYIYHIY
jgi:ABC-type Zn2+ transport system substrate-binding protein/surface adhesin